MARPRSIDDPELMAKLSGVFREEGYDGASLADLARAAGLQKASLYHRFPGGKAQMADEALADALAWFADNVLVHLNGAGAPRARLDEALANLAVFYDDGRLACLLNMLSAPEGRKRPFDSGVKAGFAALTDGFAKVARDAGATGKSADSRAIRAVALLHGGLVMARGMGDTRPFSECLSAIPETLLADTLHEGDTR